MTIKQDRINKRYRTQLALTNMEYRDGEPLNALQLLLSVFGTSLSFAGRLADQHELSKETMVQLEEQLQAIYSALAIATSMTGIVLKDPGNSEHPLKILWDQWMEHSKKVTEMARWLGQK